MRTPRGETTASPQDSEFWRQRVERECSRDVTPSLWSPASLSAAATVTPTTIQEQSNTTLQSTAWKRLAPPVPGTLIRPGWFITLTPYHLGPHISADAPSRPNANPPTFRQSFLRPIETVPDVLSNTLRDPTLAFSRGPAWTREFPRVCDSLNRNAPRASLDGRYYNPGQK